MATVLICGIGELGGWALEFLARSPGVDRIVTMRRSPTAGPSRATLAAVGAVFQDRLVRCDHRTGDVTDVAATARILREIEPDVILAAATLRTPRALADAAVDAGIRNILERAGFGMWLPNHLLPAARLTEAVMEAGLDAAIVNAAFPDVVNPAVWKRFGHGPIAGVGNGEVSAAVLAHYLATSWAVPLSDVKVALVASHAFLTLGPPTPHWSRLWVRGRDVTASVDVGAVVTAYPEPVDWRRTPVFSVFAASAVDNITSLLSPQPRYTHVTAPNGLPGSYPAHVSAAGIELALPEGITLEQAGQIAAAGNAHSGIERIDADGTVVFTEGAAAAMSELGYDGARVRFEELEDRVQQLNRLFARITATAR